MYFLFYVIYRPIFFNLALAGEEYANIWNNRALGDKYLKFSVVLGMGSVLSMGVISGDL